MALLDNIKLLCKEKGVSQRKMEQDIGISNGAIPNCIFQIKDNLDI